MEICISISFLSFFCTLLIGIISYSLISWGVGWAKARSWNSKSKRWNDKSPNKVIIHGIYGNAGHVPSVSPFVLKLETYLRISKIPFEVDETDPWGSKGKTPWISYNGEHVGDTQFIIDYLQKKFDTNLSSPFTEEQKSMATAVRLMLEDHVYWCGVMTRFAYSGRETFANLKSGKTPFSSWLIFHMIAPQMKSMARAQGLGRHSESEIQHLLLTSLTAFSEILGGKKYLLGNTPCDVDCTAFGIFAAQVFAPEANELFEGRCKNVKDYCTRIRSEFWPDWDKRIS